LAVFSETWPRWGTMRGGECWGHATPVRPTAETASGSSERWLTPTANDGKQVGEAETEMMVLYEQGTNIPDTYKRLRSQMAARERWPTPTVNDSKNNNTPPLNVRVGGNMSPMWVEWLMGWPIGWTDLRPLATDRFRQWCDLHGRP